MEFIDKNTIKIMNEDDTLGNILTNFLLKEEETEFTSYKRSHFLDKKNYIILKLYTKNLEPKDVLKKVIDKLEKNIEEIEKCFE